MNWRHTGFATAACLVLLVGAVGCAGSSASISQYNAPNFSGARIDSVAVFPIRNASAAPAEAQQLNRRVSQAVHQKSPNVGIVGPNASIERLNDNELADDWGDFYEDYATTGVPNSATLEKVGDALGVDAILQGELVGLRQVDGQYGGNKGTTNVTVRFSLLGTEDGSRLWEASSEAEKTTATTLEDAPPMIEAINLAVDKLISNMPPLGER